MISPSTPIPIPVPIPQDQIDVWFADLDGASNDAASNRNEDLLSTGERDRVAKLRASLDRQRYIASRGILRTLIGRYLAIAPQSIAFSYGTNGKPALSGLSGLHFNLSHSHGRALFAFSSSSPLGVDLELVHPLPELQQLGATIFSPAEAKAFKGVPPQDQLSAFFKCWTRKEALIKAVGTGLSYPLDRFSVSFDEPARVLSAGPDHAELSLWHLHHLEPEPNYFAAVATQHAEARLALHRL